MHRKKKVKQVVSNTGNPVISDFCIESYDNYVRSYEKDMIDQFQEDIDNLNDKVTAMERYQTYFVNNIIRFDKRYHQFVHYVDVSNRCLERAIQRLDNLKNKKESDFDRHKHMCSIITNVNSGNSSYDAFGRMVDELIISYNLQNDQESIRKRVPIRKATYRKKSC